MFQRGKKTGRNFEKPHGIVLVTGPTGSGKSTSLTAFIRRIHKPERRIMTVEDPVEYEVSGINQTQVNSEIGFTFASALREILRQTLMLLWLEKFGTVKLPILPFGHHLQDTLFKHPSHQRCTRCDYPFD